jgi:hypothetical protein
MDNGKPFMFSVGDMMLGVKALKFTAGYSDKYSGRTIPAGKLRFPQQLTIE